MEFSLSELSNVLCLIKNLDEDKKNFLNFKFFLITSPLSKFEGRNNLSSLSRHLLIQSNRKF